MFKIQRDILPGDLECYKSRFSAPLLHTTIEYKYFIYRIPHHCIIIYIKVNTKVSNRWYSRHGQPVVFRCKGSAVQIYLYLIMQLGRSQNITWAYTIFEFCIVQSLSLVLEYRGVSGTSRDEVRILYFLI